jgi:phosphoglycolate phosphatase
MTDPHPQVAAAGALPADGLEPRPFQGTAEFRPNFSPRGNIRHVLFDFDGTLSLIRTGWPEVMLPMFLELIPRRPDDSATILREMLYDDLMRLNGKQTVYQMIQFTERVRERGGQPAEPLWYKHEYLRRLEIHIRHRVEGLQNGSLAREDYLVHGARALLDALQELGLPMHLASGTDEVFVRREAELLDLTRYFGNRIYGAVDQYQNFSKQMVIERILRENRIAGEHLLSFGDGYVEIENTKQVGGVAVAVASLETQNGSGRLDEWKRERLLRAGADVVIPDFRDVHALLRFLRVHPS